MIGSIMNSIGLTDLVFPLTTREFLSTTYGHDFKHFTGESARFHPLFDWDNLNVLLETQPFDSTKVRLARHGHSINPTDYTEEIRRKHNVPYRQIVPDCFLREIRCGATLTLDHAEKAHPPLRHLARRLESELQANVSAHIFASWKPVPGFDLHWDEQDAIVVQIDGRKKWQVFAPTTPWPSRLAIAENLSPEADPIAEIELTAGDVLYMPHGWWHAVSATDGPSLHITFGVTPDNGIDLMTWLVGRLRDNELFRRRIPRLAGDTNQAGYLQSIRQALHGLLESDKLLDEFFLYSDGTSRCRPTFTLPDTLEHCSAPDLSKRVVLLAPRATISPLDEDFTLTALGRSWKFPARAKPIIDLVLLPAGALVGDVLAAVPDLPHEHVAEVLFMLQRAGVIALT